MTRILAAMVGLFLFAGWGMALLADAPSAIEVPPAEPAAEPDDVQQIATEIARLKAQLERLEAALRRLQQEQGEAAPDDAVPAVEPVVGGEPATLPRYTIDPREQLRGMIEDVDSRIRTLQARGEQEAADALTLRLAPFREGSHAAAQSDEAELHVVGLYESASKFIRKVHVEVTYTQAPIILVLTGHESIEWLVRVGEKVRLKQVIASGDASQKVEGVPEGVTLTLLTRENGNRDGFSCYKRTSGDFPRMCDMLRDLVGRDVVTFQGHYSYPGQPIVVGPESANWRAQHLIVELAALHAEATREEQLALVKSLQRLRFHALHQAGGAGPFGRGGQASWAEFTVYGPIVSKMRPLPEGISLVTSDAKGNQVFALTPTGLAKVSFNDGGAELDSLAGPLPEMKSVCGLTFDPERKRVLACTKEGAGKLMAYELDKKKWSVLASMQEMDALALAWSPHHDSLYGLHVGHGGDDEPGATLVRWTSAGAAVDSKRLKGSIPNLGHGHFPFNSCSLTAAGDRLILLAPLDAEGGRFQSATHAFVIDPQTGEVEYTAELKPQQ